MINKSTQSHTVSELTALSFIPRQYSWDYRHEQELMSIENNMLHLLCQTNYKQPTHAFQIFSKLLQNSLYKFVTLFLS